MLYLGEERRLRQFLFFESAVVDVYSGSLAKTTVTSLSQARCELAATTVGSYALFGGGYSSHYFSTVDTYNSSLTKGTATSLSRSRRELAATTVGNYALFGGGFGSSAYNSTVDTYNVSLTKGTTTSLSQGRSILAATTVGNYAIFAGGYMGNDLSNVSAAVDAYNQNLTRVTPSSLNNGKEALIAANTPSYALFGGGYKTNFQDGTGYYDNNFADIDAYNQNLVKSTPNSLSAGRRNLGATNLGPFAIFAGGYSLTGVYHSGQSGTKTYYSNVDIYYDSLAKSTGSNLQSSRQLLAATTIGNYAVFAGGENSSQFLSDVDVYINKDSMLELNVYKGSKYKFQNMAEEKTVTSDIEVISIPIPATGYVKFKNITIS